MTRIIGHRGAAGLALENSPDSILAAAELGLGGIEFDVRATVDKQLIVLHDAHTGRVAERRLVVARTPWHELKKLRLNNGQHIMTLDEALKLCGNTPIVLDVKATGMAEPLSAVIAKYPKADITLSSRKYADLRRLHKAMPHIPFFAQSHVKPAEAVHVAHQLRANGVSMNKWLMNPLAYYLARRTGLEVRVYTVNHLWLLKLITRLYPGVTIYTDHPERFLHLMEKRDARNI